MNGKYTVCLNVGEKGEITKCLNNLFIGPYPEAAYYNFVWGDDPTVFFTEDQAVQIASFVSVLANVKAYSVCLAPPVDEVVEAPVEAPKRRRGRPTKASKAQEN